MFSRKFIIEVKKPKVTFDDYKRDFVDRVLALQKHKAANGTASPEEIQELGKFITKIKESSSYTQLKAILSDAPKIGGKYFGTSAKYDKLIKTLLAELSTKFLDYTQSYADEPKTAEMLHAIAQFAKGHLVVSSTSIVSTKFNEFNRNFQLVRESKDGEMTILPTKGKNHTEILIEVLKFCGSEDTAALLEQDAELARSYISALELIAAFDIHTTSAIEIVAALNNSRDDIDNPDKYAGLFQGFPQRKYEQIAWVQSVLIIAKKMPPMVKTLLANPTPIDTPLYNYSETILNQALISGATLKITPKQYTHQVIRQDGVPPTFSMKLVADIDRIHITNNNGEANTQCLTENTDGTLALQDNDDHAYPTLLHLTQIVNLGRDGTRPSMGEVSVTVVSEAAQKNLLLKPAPDKIQDNDPEAASRVKPK